MYGYEVNEMIKEDITTLKSLNIAILPRKEFYKKLLRIALPIYFILVIISCLTMSLFLNKASAIVSDFVQVCFLMIIPGFIIFTKVAEYIMFKYSLKPHLKLGKLLDDQFHYFLKIFIIAYSILQALCVLFFHNPNLNSIGERVFDTLGCFILASFITNWFVTMEITRVGIASLFQVIQSFFNNNNKKTWKS